MAQRGRAEYGALAPALDLPTPAGGPRSLEEFRGRPVVVSFLGPANCLFCRAHVLRLVQARDEVAKLGADVILVAFHDPDLLMSKMMHDLELPYVLLYDPARQAYAQWGLGQATLRSKLTPGLYLAMLRELLKVMTGRERALGDASDPGQLGGDFVVNGAGRIVFVKRMKSFHDRASIGDLLAALAAPTAASRVA